MTGYVTGSEAFVWASYAVSALTLICLAGWTWAKLNAAKKKLEMLETTAKKD